MRVVIGGGDYSNVNDVLISNKLITAGGDARPIVEIVASQQN